MIFCKMVKNVRSLKFRLAALFRIKDFELPAQKTNFQLKIQASQKFKFQASVQNLGPAKNSSFSEVQGMKQGKIAATRGLRPTSRLQCSQTSSAGGGSMRRRLGWKRSRRKKLSRSRSQTSLLQQVLPSMSRFKLRRMQLKVLQHLLVHHSRSDRREDPRRPSADDPARGGTLSDGWQLLV